jgi:hypothetical protein
VERRLVDRLSGRAVSTSGLVPGRKAWSGWGEGWGTLLGPEGAGMRMLGSFGPLATDSSGLCGWGRGHVFGRTAGLLLVSAEWGWFSARSLRTVQWTRASLYL